MEILARRLKELREERSLKQSELAVVLNVRNTTISSWETDSSEPDCAMLVKLAHYFDVSTDYLLGVSEEY